VLGREIDDERELGLGNLTSITTWTTRSIRGAQVQPLDCVARFARPAALAGIGAAILRIAAQSWAI